MFELRVQQNIDTIVSLLYSLGLIAIKWRQLESLDSSGSRIRLRPPVLQGPAVLYYQIFSNQLVQR